MYISDLYIYIYITLFHRKLFRKTDLKTFQWHFLKAGQSHPQPPQKHLKGIAFSAKVAANGGLAYGNPP